MPDTIPSLNSKSAITTGTPLIGKSATTQIDELPKFTCSASVGIPTEGNAVFTSYDQPETVDGGLEAMVPNAATPYSSYPHGRDCLCSNRKLN